MSGRISRLFKRPGRRTSPGLIPMSPKDQRDLELLHRRRREAADRKKETRP